MDYLKAIDRVRKLLRLAEGAGSEAEAASAAAQAADLMAEFQLSEAVLKLETGDDKRREAIVEGAVPGAAKKKRVAWQSTIADAVAASYGCKQFWRGKEIAIYGRESSVQAVNYTCQYLFREVERLCSEAWEREAAKTEDRSYYEWRADKGDGEPGYVVVSKTVSLGRGWKNAFRVGAANAISRRLYVERRKRRDNAVRAARRAHDEAPAEAKVEIKADALALIARDEREVEVAYEEKSKSFRTVASIGQVSSSSGYKSGKAAGESVAIGGKRAGLPAGQGRLKGDK